MYTLIRECSQIEHIHGNATATVNGFTDYTMRVCNDDMRLFLGSQTL